MSRGAAAFAAVPAAALIGASALSGCSGSHPAGPNAPPSPAASAPAATSATTNARPATVTTTSAGRVATAPSAEWSLVTEPADGIQPIYDLMSSARHTLDMTMYELADPEAVTILEADAARGVGVRVLLDRDYSGASVNASAYAELSAHGVQVRWAYPDAIFHQKTITVDSTTSAIMTLNLTSEYYATTRDFAVVTTDAEDVSAVESVFDQDWSATGPPAPGAAGPGLVWSPGSAGALESVIDGARHSLLIENEEMDDSAIESALEAAAGRGVDVQIVMTDSSEWATAFTGLVRAGVHVSTYPADGSLYIHAKVIVADGTTAFVGSENFSRSSLDDNRELGLATTVPSVVQPIAATVQADFEGAAPFAPPG